MKKVRFDGRFRDGDSAGPVRVGHARRRDLSPEDLGSVVIWCRAFRVILRVAAFSPAMS